MFIPEDTFDEGGRCRSQVIRVDPEPTTDPAYVMLPGAAYGPHIELQKVGAPGR
ncbi:MAG: hypothetical protein ACRDVM_08350 [Acidimicrobiia bacterium]